MDEATASVDNETDMLVQQTVNTKVRATGASVITIAHRINTIMENDYVMVMKAGTCLEFGPTQTLLANKQGEFYGMASASGLIKQDDHGIS